MREEYNDYDDTRYDDEYGYEEQVDNKAVRGYRIVIIILAVILVALSVKLSLGVTVTKIFRWTLLSNRSVLSFC